MGLAAWLLLPSDVCVQTPWCADAMASHLCGASRHTALQAGNIGYRVARPPASKPANHTCAPTCCMPRLSHLSPGCAPADHPRDPRRPHLPGCSDKAAAGIRPPPAEARQLQRWLQCHRCAAAPATGHRCYMSQVRCCTCYNTNAISAYPVLRPGSLGMLSCSKAVPSSWPHGHASNSSPTHTNSKPS
jgi:hypothetical protein